MSRVPSHALGYYISVLAKKSNICAGIARKFVNEMHISTLNEGLIMDHTKPQKCMRYGFALLCKVVHYG